jgi:hypothetical protein
MRAHTTQIGFEFEFCATTTATDIITDLEAKLKLPFSGKYDQRWRMMFDSSIQPKHFRFGHELVTPPLDYKDAIRKLNDVLAWMLDKQHCTNRTTALHVNLSFTDKNCSRKVDPVKLIVFTPCNEMLAQYKRQRNIYCKSYDNDFARWSRRLVQEGQTSWKQAVNHFNLRLQLAADSKYRAISFHTNPKNPYFEFRMIGNTGYQNRFAEIKLNIDEMVEALHISSSSKACLIEYEQVMSDYVLY